LDGRAAILQLMQGGGFLFKEDEQSLLVPDLGCEGYNVALGPKLSLKPKSSELIVRR